MATIYECVGCGLHYCVTCDGGEDQCQRCSTGPRCEECASEHEQEHEEQDREASDEARALAGAEGMDRWARRYDELNGAPENDEDR